MVYVMPSDNHLNEFDLRENGQRGAKSGCSGTSDNLLIDRMVTLDRYRGKRNQSMAWIDVKKAYDSVDYSCLRSWKFTAFLLGCVES